MLTNFEVVLGIAAFSFAAEGVLFFFPLRVLESVSVELVDVLHVIKALDLIDVHTQSWVLAISR